VNSALSAPAVLASAPLVAPPSRHESDLPDVPMNHPPPDNAKQIKAWHILIAYKGAQDADPKVTRSRAEAKALAEHVAMDARAGADFEGLVAKYSDDPKAKTNRGNLGELTRTSMVKPFTEAAFGLMKQEIGYQPVETVFGFHIIKRTE
jgi:parvulin-like peptidyl-prolyl isomerase